MEEETEVSAGVTAGPDENGVWDLDKMQEEQLASPQADPDEIVDGPEAEEIPEPEEKKRPSGAQRAKQQRDHLLSELAERDRRIAELEAGSKPKKKISEADFNGDLYAYEQAVSAEQRRQEAREAAEAVLKERDDASNKERLIKAEFERREAHLERVEVARKMVPDFDKVMEGIKETQIRNDLVQEIMSSDQSAMIAYHLARHPNELAALDQLPSNEMARSIGRLEERIERALSAKKATTAPPPLSKPKGAATVLDKDQNADLKAWLKKSYGEIA